MNEIFVKCLKSKGRIELYVIKSLKESTQYLANWNKDATVFLKIGIIYNQIYLWNEPYFEGIPETISKYKGTGFT